MAFTVNVIVVVFVQPEALAPVTVYVVVTVGDTLTGVPIKPPGFQVYDVAPKADKVAVLPTQIEVVLNAAVTVGLAITVKLMVALPIHPKVVVPDTEYVVVTVGDTLTGDPINEPGFQV